MNNLWTSDVHKSHHLWNLRTSQVLRLVLFCHSSTLLRMTEGEGDFSTLLRMTEGAEFSFYHSERSEEPHET